MKAELIKSLNALSWTDSECRILQRDGFISDQRCSQALEKRRYAALEKWTEALENVHSAIVSKTSGSRNGDPLTISMSEAFAAYA